ncbi:MAG: transporter [Sinobacteraceae bacterium]|nr:transporter [Nevskiaceae bacterium]
MLNIRNRSGLKLCLEAQATGTPRFTLRAIIALITLGACAVSFSAFATQNGRTHFPVGAQTVIPAIMPPPGHTQYFNYDLFINAGRFADDAGNSAIPGFGARVFAQAFRLVHTWKPKLGPFNISSEGVFTLVNTNLNAAGRHFQKLGIADPTLVPIYVSYGTKTLHFLLGPNIWFPVGTYNSNNPASPGMNYWTFAMEAAVTWFPIQYVEISMDSMTSVNTVNTTTDFRSGKNTNFDFGINWQPLPAYRKIAFGIQGYWLHQWSDDQQNGVDISGSRTEVLALGPQVIWYAFPRGGIVFKWQHKLYARNSTEGNQFWIQFTVPVGDF